MKKNLVLCIAGLMLCGLVGCKKESPAPVAQPVVAPAATAPAADGTVAPAAAPNAAPAANGTVAADGTVVAAPTADPNAPAVDPNAPAVDPNAVVVAESEAVPEPPQGPQIPPPADVAAPPADALKTVSGVAYKKIVPNDAGTAITGDSIVRMKYTGWTTDGKTFDSSLENVVTFGLDHLIPGMKEVILLSKKGEKIHSWIPQELAYNGRPGAPAGMLVFEYEIVDVINPVMPPKDIPEDAVKLDNGVAYRIVKNDPAARKLDETDLVALDFSGWTQNDGKRFQTSAEMGEPLMAPVNSMFPGWKSVLPNAHVGDVIQMWIPQELGISPNGELAGTLIFEVTVQTATPLPIAPADVAAPGADTQKTESGISWRITTPGTGTEHPKPESTVKVHYSGWTTDGVMFDSSVARGEPIEFPLNAVIPGWSEAVQLMVVGEKRVVWIPEELAYKGQPGAPAGTLCFEIELLEIK